MKAFHASFKKIRVKDNDKKKSSEIDVLLNKKKTILKKKHMDEGDKEEVERIEKYISDKCEDAEYDKLESILGSLETSAGTTDMSNVWKQMRKSYPKKVRPLPTGVKNVSGKVITNPEEKKKVILEHFRHRMRKRPAQDDVKNVIKNKEALYRKRTLAAQNVKSPPFQMTELETILKSLMVGKSRDPEYMVCDIFNEGVIGDDLKESILMMFNKMKQQTTIPECMKTATITMLHKKKMQT